MEIIRADKLGFCFGVEKAIETCYELERQNKQANKYILGMVVHNKDVVKKLEEIGFETVTEENLLEKNLGKDDILVIRAHGESRETYKFLENRGVQIFDATCIFVKKIRDILVEEESKGKDIIFIGDKDHPEVKGIISFGDRVEVIKNIEELKLKKLDEEKEYSVLTQTTLNKSKFIEIKEYLQKNYSKVQIFDRICGATSERQEATIKLSKEVDIIFVIGDEKSSNSKKLLEVAKKYNENSYLIQNEKELELSLLKNKKRIGIAAGASTPEEVIKQVENKIRGNIND